MTMIAEWTGKRETRPQPTDRQTYRALVAEIAAKARAKLPECNGRVDKAVALVLQGDVELLPDGTARVYSQSDGITSYRVVNGACDCKDYERAPSHQCKHRIAYGIQTRAQQGIERRQGQAPPASGIDPRFLVVIQQRPFVKFEGLLHLANARGLVSLETTVISVSTELAVCQAVARFADGRVFTDIGDASPDNVAQHLRPHFIRMAATRASARALRRALNINDCAVEELGDEAAA